MNDEQLLELWEMRYKKAMKLEVEALQHYKLLLRKYSHVLDGSRIKQMIRKIMRDEAQHIKIAKKLLDLVTERKRICQGNTCLKRNE